MSVHCSTGSLSVHADLKDLFYNNNNTCFKILSITYIYFFQCRDHNGNTQLYCFIVLPLADVIFMFIETVLLHWLNKLLLVLLLLLHDLATALITILLRLNNINNKCMHMKR